MDGGFVGLQFQSHPASNQHIPRIAVVLKHIQEGLSVRSETTEPVCRQQAAHGGFKGPQLLLDLNQTGRVPNKQKEKLKEAKDVDSPLKIS